MPEPEIAGKRRVPETEIQVAAAAITAAISPPLGIAVAAGSALRSRRVREALRKGIVNALADAMSLTDRLTSAAGASEDDPRGSGAPHDDPRAAGASQDEPSAAEAAQDGQASAAQNKPS